MKPAGSTARIFPLEGLRGLAALAVLVWHVMLNTAPEWLSLHGAPAPLRFTLADLGRHGVSLFFVLSGFLLGMPFLRWLLAGGRPVPLCRYVRARVLRIYPAWLVAVAIVVPLQGAWLLSDPLRLGLFGSLQQYAYDARSVRMLLPQSWTLTVEVWFYLLLPLAMLAAGPLLLRLAERSRVAVTCSALAAVVVACVLWKAFGFTADRAPRVDLRPFNFLVLSFADHFALGMLAAAAFVTAGRRWRPRPRVLLALSAGVYLLDQWTLRPVLSDVLSRTVIAGAFALLVLAVALAPSGPLGRTLASTPLATLGRLSYGLYLWHYPLVLLLRHEGLLQPHHRAQTLPMIALVLAGSLGAAALSYRFVEAPALARVDRPQKRFRGRLTAGVAAPAGPPVVVAQDQ